MIVNLRARSRPSLAQMGLKVAQGLAGATL
jgi:hypothetical protein